MTEIWWWPVPAEGEIVPDYPPVELSPYISEVTFEDDVFGRTRIVLDAPDSDKP